MTSNFELSGVAPVMTHVKGSESTRTRSNLLLLCAVPDGAGAMRMMASFASQLAASEFNVTVVYGNSTATSQSLPGSAVRILDSLSSQGIRTVAMPGFRKRFSLQLQRSLRRYISDHHIEAVIAFHPLDIKYALMLARKSGTRCIISAQNKHVFWGNRLVARVKQLIYANLIRRHANRVVCTSEPLYREVLNFGVSPARCCIVPNGIPLEAYAPDRSLDTAQIRESLGIEPHELLLVNTGRLDVQKGQDLLLEALSHVHRKDWKLLLIGDVSEGRSNALTQGYRDKLSHLVAKHNWKDRVHFLGWRDDIPKLLAIADLYVHAARWEGPAAPLAVMEAMAAEKPVVLSDCSGRPIGFNDGEHGFVFRSESSTELAKYLNQSMELPNQSLTKMGLNCRRLVEENFDISVVAARFVTEVRKAVAV